MATYRVAKLLKSKSEFSDEEIERMSERDAWKWIQGSMTRRESADRESPEAEKNRDWS
jgi:hypothetical protein